ncbi:histidine kinase [Myroides sp. 1354]|uniref:sensor histidine kinase n=1 Tax=unclassified Myroides TaxID=2642485 RepID=UPI0025786F8A|nr:MULTISPECIES: histidine kinase [unclassified Myroides]MDM1043872.1 histidine kinase [Myroides sp. R163-1]MDM1054807.1 histidine kinase [Myroides sp. 1354]MDM1068104.1 histidine kinase [Myroides sp. 1372]
MKINWYRHLILAVNFGIVSSLSTSYYFYTKTKQVTEASFSDYLFSKNAMLSFLITLSIYGANVLTSLLLSYFLDRREQKTQVPLSRKLRNILFFANGLCVSVLSYYFFLSVLLWIFYQMPFQSFYSGKNLHLSDFLGVLLISFFIIMIVFVFSYNDQLRVLELKNKEMEIALQKSQIAHMKEQLSPHFLFNNLNVLISTIQEDPVKAEQFARSFSKIYRYVLERLDDSSCALAEEVAFIRDYIYLLNVRYDQAIDFQIDDAITPWEEVQIPTLSLQLLIENVVKHNTIPSQGKLVVVLSVEDGNLVMRNEKYGKPKLEYSTKLGLKNLSKRCQLLLQKEIEIEDEVDYFSVKIPLFSQYKV